jgi:cytochrome o ubiquinol oxidase subunit 3
MNFTPMQTNPLHTDDKVTFGFWVYLMSDCVLFAGLFATYAVLQGQTFGSATIYEITNLPYVFIETMLLLTSSFTMGIAVVAANARKEGKTWPNGLESTLLWHWRLLIPLILTLILGLGFLGMEAHEFMHLIAEGSGPDKSAFLSAFFALLGTHGLHVLVGSVWMLVVIAHVFVKGLTPATLRKLTCLSLFWHFLDIIWIFIFTLVYLMGALAL